MIQNIEIGKLHPHPDNPRRGLGDLSELVESIKVSGVLQNLTVVPWFSKETGVGCDDSKQQEKMGYTVVIGHRRLEAAKLAGLTEVPCVISNIPLREQVAAMLLENIQRSDLTVYEQAQGFQMMMNLGDSVGDIVQRTGFSETTVRRRVKLLELDQKKFEAASEHGATLFDFAELDKINRLDLKNAVLGKFGTANFKMELERAIQKEKEEARKAAWIEALSAFATPIEEDAEGYVRCYYYNTYNDPESTLKVPEDAESTEYFFNIDKWGSIRLYKEDDGQQEQQEDPEAAKRRERFEYRQNGLKEATNRAFKCRIDFLQKVSAKTIKKHMGDLITTIVMEYVQSYPNIDYDKLIDLIGVQIPESGDDEEPVDVDIASMAAIAIENQPEKSLLMLAYCTIGDDYTNGYYQYWRAQHDTNENLDRLYTLYEKLGYEMSDEEKALRDGTHELFIDPDAEVETQPEAEQGEEVEPTGEAEGPTEEE